MAAEDWVRVKDPDTKHEFTVHRTTFEAAPKAYEELKNKDATDEAGAPLPAKPHITPKQAEQIKKENA